MSYPSWFPPDEKDVAANIAKEPEGERLRRELTEWLERNHVCSGILDTTHHHVSIHFGPNLPNEIMSVLSIWGAIDVVVSDDVDWKTELPVPAKTKSLTRRITIPGTRRRFTAYDLASLLQHPNGDQQSTGLSFGLENRNLANALRSVAAAVERGEIVPNAASVLTEANPCDYAMSTFTLRFHEKEPSLISTIPVPESPDELRAKLLAWLEKHGADPNISAQLWNELHILAETAEKEPG